MMTEIISIDEAHLSDEIISNIIQIDFSLLSSEHIEQLSFAEINESKLTGEGRVYDDRLGEIRNYKKCITCDKNNQECPGHFGHINLPIPIPHPMYLEDILSFLNSFCSECSSLLLNIKELHLLNYFSYKGLNRWKRIQDYIFKLKTCSHCNADKYTYYVDNNKFFKYYKVKDKESVPVKNIEIENIIGKIKRKDLNLIAIPKNFHPINLIITKLPVLPTCARPYVESNRGLCDDDLTSKYIEHIKCTNKLKNVYNTSNKKNKDENTLVNELEFHISTMMYNYKNKARQINGRPIKCIRSRLNGKDGLFRTNLLGKRGDWTGRTVIGPDTKIKVDEILIPVEFAKKQTFPEPVTKHNLKKLEELVNTGQAPYIYINNKRIDVKYISKTKDTYLKNNIDLLSGDIIIRNNKKIDADKFKTVTGKDLILTTTDMIIRNNKLLKITKQSERVPLLLEEGDIVYRDGKRITNKFLPCNFTLIEGDKVFRDNKELKDIQFSKKKYIELKEGYIVERYVQNGEYVLFGRQPTLHLGSMIARKVRIIHNTSGINGGREISTIRFNVAATETYNADFDGDEMNLYFPQTYSEIAELQHLSSASALIKSNQSARLLITIKFDTLTGGHLLTMGEYRSKENNKFYKENNKFYKENNKFYEENNKFYKENNKKEFQPYVLIPKDRFMNALCQVSQWDMDYISHKFEHISKVIKWKNLPQEFLYSGHSLISFLLPDDFEYSFFDIKVNNKIVITRGVMLSGTISKTTIANNHLSIVHKLDKDYGAQVAIDFVSYYQFLINYVLVFKGFSIGIEDCILNDKSKKDRIENEINKAFTEAHTIEMSETDPDIREMKVNAALNNVRNIGEVLSKDVAEFNNSLHIMVKSGAKGSFANISQIRALLGQQNIDGKRVGIEWGKRSLPHYKHKLFDNKSELNDYERRQKYQSRGFISNCFVEGLSPQEFFWHASSGRVGVIDTAVKTSKSGYIQRRLVKKMENVTKSYAKGLVTASNNNIIQFNYGNNFDPSKLVKVKGKMTFANIGGMIEKLNMDKEFEEFCV